jgi:hypothetical protein
MSDDKKEIKKKLKELNDKVRTLQSYLDGHSNSDSIKDLFGGVFK